MTLPEPAKGDVFKGRTAMLPTTLLDARATLVKSKMLLKAFGADVVQHYARAAEWENEEFDRIVTDYEVARRFDRAQSRSKAPNTHPDSYP